MNRLRINVLAGAAFAALAVLAIIAGCTSKMVLPARAPAALSAPTLPPELATNLSPALKPGPNDARIAYVTARLLENFHYSQQPFDTEISEKFFDAYLDSLDPRHENFLQSDLDEFAPYRTNLAVLTLGTNLAPAYVIYQRYLERIRQHADYVNELLSEDKFKFNTDEQVVLDRRHAPWPRDLDEARQLWSLRLRYEYLQEKLSREISPTNSAVIIPLSKTNAIDIRDSLARHYRWNLHQATNWNSTDVLQAYLNALAHAYDPHSDYFNPEHAQDFSISMSLSLFGIGAQLTEDDGYCTISSLVPGGPAEKSKQLHEKDRIVAVAQGGQPFVDVVDMELGRVVQLIRGSKGSQVRLMISPAEDRAARREVTLVRDEIKLEDQEAKAQLIEWTDARGGTNRIGIIDLPSFYATIDLPGNSDHPAAKSTTADVARLIRKLKAENVSGIILDLRSNPGGSLEEAVRFTGLFIKNGPVVLARSPDGTVNVDSDPDGSQLYDGPLVVLVNRFSASASEIAAAALQDYGRALVVGDVSTFGKGTVQNLNPLRPWVWPTPAVTNDPGTVKITIRKFYRISGASTQLKGVMPDIVLPDVLSYSTQFGESALENPLPWDVITNVNYTKLDLVQPYLADLRSRSAERLATNQDFAYVHQDIDDYLKRQSDKTASLNEHKRLEERQENDARQKARDAERAARKAPDVKIYNLTVKLAGEPGL
ncbi:MAG TPA: carboxy terminal-processing peptidase, partial [Candidatus Acidoferrum sp.]|nr:carboxy terminal-processing peptidase [Candidatus Acidoferrum sp.]